MQGAGLTSSGPAPCRIKAAASGLIVILHRSVNMLPLLNFSLSPETNTTGAVDWTQVYEAVRWIQLIMALFSILGSGSIICLIIPRLSHTPELQPLFQLSVADLLLAACWLIGAVLYSQRCNQLSLLCYNLHTVEQILYMASFFFTLNYVWNLYTVTREKFNSCFSGYSVQKVSLQSGRCPCRAEGVPAERKVSLQSGRCPCRVEGVPAERPGAHVFALFAPQAFTSASQGFLNCLVYGWTRLHLRRAGLMFFSRDVDTQTPLLRSQQSRSYHTPRTIG
ncbi:PREDICTED: transmembrane protein 116 [Cyprinodon variegatus]|uniref:transmembrane protein 116 n=1 Tax=Cyprinodon variegatus TaxID=28743 RepID=UPI00074271C9|nr:PREDICTED: transmembrane protein 116 [Cyprinodon variegatus]